MKATKSTCICKAHPYNLCDYIASRLKGIYEGVNRGPTEADIIVEKHGQVIRVLGWVHLREDVLIDMDVAVRQAYKEFLEHQKDTGSVYSDSIIVENLVRRLPPQRHSMCRKVMDVGYLEAAVYMCSGQGATELTPCTAAASIAKELDDDAARNYGILPFSIVTVDVEQYIDGADKPVPNVKNKLSAVYINCVHRMKVGCDAITAYVAAIALPRAYEKLRETGIVVDEDAVNVHIHCTSEKDFCGDSFRSGVGYSSMTDSYGRHAGHPRQWEIETGGAKHIYFLCSKLAAMAINELAAEEVRASLRIDYAGVISAEIDTFGTTEQDAEQVSEWAGRKLAMLLETYGGTDKCTSDDNESGDF